MQIQAKYKLVGIDVIVFRLLMSMTSTWKFLTKYVMVTCILKQYCSFVDSFKCEAGGRRNSIAEGNSRFPNSSVFHSMLVICSKIITLPSSTTKNKPFFHAVCSDA